MPPLSRGLIIAAVIAALILAVGALMLTCVVPGVKYCSDKNKAATVEVWGVFDDTDAFKPLIDAYRALRPNVRVSYRKMDARDPKRYEQELLEAFAAGRGPDIFFIHHTWLKRYREKLRPLPEDLMALREFKETFVDVAVEDLTRDGQIYALPLYVDTLALYYNQDMLNSARLSKAPATWTEFNAAVPKLVSVDARTGAVTRAAATIGTAKNINRSTDILALLMLQSGTAIVDRKTSQVVMDESKQLNGQAHRPGLNALEFYTAFTDPGRSVYTWGVGSSFHWSVDAFAEESAAMTFNYAYQLPVIRQKNPNLRFGISGMPQIENRTIDVNYASYWAPAVSFQSRNARAAWEFLVFASGKDAVVSYLKATQRPPARRDLMETFRSDPNLGVFAEQALTARSFYQYDSSQVEQIFADMIEAVVKREKTLNDALETAVNAMRVATK
ncbi:extracellular solute-binding protein [Candidatus Parcubacteria bacterium]|nr:extracellular solute-binding protein [Candidatus Parcubacteria bacterium]